MRNLKLIFIEQSLTEQELDSVIGRGVKCPNLNFCETYAGDCPKINKCGTFSNKATPGGTSGGIIS